MLTKSSNETARYISSAWPEQFVEQIAEPCLEHVKLGVGDRHMLRPIVANGPGLDIVLDGPSEARPRTGRDDEIVGQDAAFGAAAAR